MSAGLFTSVYLLLVTGWSADANVGRVHVRVTAHSGQVALLLPEVHPAQAAELKVVPRNPALEPDAFTIQAGSPVTVSCSARNLLLALEPGTRSLMLDGSAGPLRVDLPTVEWSNPKIAPDPSRSGGLLLTLKGQGVLPGAAVTCQVRRAGELLLDGRLDARGPIAQRQFGYADDGTALLTLAFPAWQQNELLELRLVLINPDGSKSSTFSVVMRGGKLNMGQTGAAAPAPVAIPVLVPSVELLPLREAEQRLRAAGVVPRLVGGTATPSPDALVLRQGLTYRDPAWQGQEVWLQLETAAADDWPSDDWEQGSDDPENAGIAGQTTPLLDVFDLADVAAGASAAPQTGLFAPGEDTARSNELAVVLDPTLDPWAAVARTILRRAHVRLGDYDVLPPCRIVALLNILVERYELPLAAAISSGSGNFTEADELLRTIAETMAWSIPASALQESATALGERLQVQPHPCEWDANGDGRLVDDVFIWWLARLLRDGHRECLHWVEPQFNPLGPPTILIDDFPEPPLWTEIPPDAPFDILPPPVPLDFVPILPNAPKPPNGPTPPTSQTTRPILIHRASRRSQAN